MENSLLIIYSTFKTVMLTFVNLQSIFIEKEKITHQL